MLEILRVRPFRTLFAAQVVALLGTGLATVALALLAYDLAGDAAGAVLGTALAIKMTVYVLVAPLASAFVPLAHRKAVLIALDAIRAAVALALPFVTEIWQVYLLIALLQSASAAFTPLFQSLIPELLPDEKDYTRALSLSRLAYDLESLLSPGIAAALLTVISFHGLFGGTSVGFVLSGLLVAATLFPHAPERQRTGGPFARAILGMRIYLRTPRLRALLALNLAAAAGGAMVFVNTVVLVRDVLGGKEGEVAWALAAFGAGSMFVALLLPKWLEWVGDRKVMLGSAAIVVLVLAVMSGVWQAQDGRIGWASLVPAWVALGMAYAGLVTPGGRLLRRSAHAGDMPSLFAAQFSLSHVCWLVAYPLAGWVGASGGFGMAFVGLCCLALIGLVAAAVAWPSSDPVVLEHRHDDLPLEHAHLAETPGDGSRLHAHDFVIDPLHTRWPG